MSITTEIERLQKSKSDIRTSIINKGVDVDESLALDDYPSKVDLIEQDTSVPKFPINTMLPTYFNGSWSELWSHYTKSGYTNCCRMFYDYWNNGNHDEENIDRFQNITSIDLSNFDVSSVTDMSEMFSYSKFTSINMSNWDTSNVTDMEGMFTECKNLTSLDLSSFNTSNVTYMGSFTMNCDSLSSIILGDNFVYNSIGDKSAPWQGSYFPKLASQDFESVKWFLTSMVNTTKLPPVRYQGLDEDNTGVDDDESGTLQTLLNKCVSKGWTIYNLIIK